MSVSEVAARLPEIWIVRRWSLALAVLDAILSPEWEWRYFSFDTRWSPDEEMGSMRNGSGDEYTIVFSNAGAYIRGFDHESRLSPWAQSPAELVVGLVDAVPDSLRPNIHEPAFTLDAVPAITVCMWRERDQVAWRFGVPDDPGLRDDDGGASWLFRELDGIASTYAEFAEDYYDVPVNLRHVQRVFAFEPLVPDLVVSLNSSVDIEEVIGEVREMGYPT